MKTLLLSLTSSAIVGLSSAAMANMQPPLNPSSPLQQYSSADSETNESSGASNATEQPPVANDATPDPAVPAAPAAPAPATPPLNSKDQTAQNEPFDPTYDEDVPSPEGQSGQ